MTSDLRSVVRELRLVASQMAKAERQPTERQLLELADIVENALLRIEVQDTERAIAAFTSMDLGRR